MKPYKFSIKHDKEKRFHLLEKTFINRIYMRENDDNLSGAREKFVNLLVTVMPALFCQFSKMLEAALDRFDRVYKTPLSDNVTKTFKEAMLTGTEVYDTRQDVAVGNDDGFSFRNLPQLHTSFPF